MVKLTSDETKWAVCFVKNREFIFQKSDFEFYNELYIILFEKVGFHMNVAIYFNDIPPVDDMLNVCVQMSSCSSAPATEVSTRDIVEHWNESKIDAFVVIGVSDKKIREAYKNANCRADEIQSSVKEFADKQKKDSWVDIVIKRLYRFNTPAAAGRYLSYLASFEDNDFCNVELYEAFMEDRINKWFHYEDPWVFARELTEDDWKPGGLFYEELSSHYEPDEPGWVYRGILTGYDYEFKSMTMGIMRRYFLEE